ncbi:MAG: amidohydrolase, partial [Bacteroidota bacterium]
TNTDVLIRDGKIAQIGQQLSPNGATVINAEGKHLTAGIIDEHSHIAISRGVNEGTQVSSAEVRIGDVIDPEDINIYRQLAGGVTTSQLLHGSANPIGGQSAIIKLRWGYPAEAMKFEGADGFIKFALGENVKQSNWGDNWTIRFPQTRMGVEQVFEDYFTRAREYAKLRASNSKYRRDLDLEAVLEILQSKRFITCHSYQQGEINMLMKVAERHGFRVNTFTHVLEGYKVADKMVQHQAGGSTFSDWWAYKYEVIDAIPHNGALMHEQGVLTAFNSDDAEMGRRLNQEAAKAVQHGNVSEEDALKFVTLHPAKLLHIDQRVGSIKVGKDADIVLWSEHPLSVYSKAEKTFIDGIIFFDRDTDKLLQAQNQKERARLVQKSLEAKEGGAPTQQAKSKYRHLYHCDHMQDEAR